MKKTITLLIVCAMLGGCKSYKEKFKSGTVANIGFFADHTVTMMSSLDMQQGRDEALLTRRFFVLEEPEEQRLLELDQQFQGTISSLIQYSLKLVSISEGAATEEQMVKRYVKYLESFRDNRSTHDSFEEEKFNSILADVREQEKFLDALRMAQPLLNAAVMKSIVEVNELTQAIDELVDKVELKIDEEYADVARCRKVLEDEKSDILRAFEIIYSAYRTDEPDLSGLKEAGIIWMPELVPEGVPTREELEAIGDHLEARLNALNRVQKEVDPEWGDYLDTHRELKLIAKRGKTTLQQTQIVMLTWVRAHQKMAAGVKDPAKWFDVGASTKALLQTAPRAIL
jgi:hypothetical protein